MLKWTFTIDDIETYTVHATRTINTKDSEPIANIETRQTKKLLRPCTSMTTRNKAKRMVQKLRNPETFNNPGRLETINHTIIENIIYDTCLISDQKKEPKPI